MLKINIVSSRLSRHDSRQTFRIVQKSLVTGRSAVREVSLRRSGQWSDGGGEGTRSMSNYRTVVPSVVFSQDIVMANIGQERNKIWKNPVTRKIFCIRLKI